MNTKWQVLLNSYIANFHKKLTHFIAKIHVLHMWYQIFWFKSNIICILCCKKLLSITRSKLCIIDRRKTLSNKSKFTLQHLIVQHPPTQSLPYLSTLFNVSIYLSTWFNLSRYIIHFVTRLQTLNYIPSPNNYLLSLSLALSP